VLAVPPCRLSQVTRPNLLHWGKGYRVRLLAAENRWMVLQERPDARRAEVGAVAPQMIRVSEHGDIRPVVQRALDDAAVTADVSPIPIRRLPGRKERVQVMLDACITPTLPPATVLAVRIETVDVNRLRGSSLRAGGSGNRKRAHRNRAALEEPPACQRSRHRLTLRPRPGEPHTSSRATSPRTSRESGFPPRTFHSTRRVATHTASLAESDSLSTNSPGLR
jgi:hypothetical protein